MKKKIFLVITWVFLSGLKAIAASNVNLNRPIENGNPVTIPELQNIIGVVANFMVILAPVLFVISLVLSGITYMTAGANEAMVQKAKAWLKYSIIGGLIIFGTGVIINTIAAVVSREFFCQFSILGVCVIN